MAEHISELSKKEKRTMNVPKMPQETRRGIIYRNEVRSHEVAAATLSSRMKLRKPYQDNVTEDGKTLMKKAKISVIDDWNGWLHKTNLQLLH